MRLFIATVVVILAPIQAWASGWYLMLPPYRKAPVIYGTSLELLFRAVDTEAPFTAWDNNGSFDTALNCMNSRLNRQALSHEKATAALNKAKTDMASLSATERMDIVLEDTYRKGICLATDDPRLTVSDKEWRLLKAARLAKFQAPPRFVDEIFDMNAAPKAREIGGTYTSRWACEEAKEAFVAGFLTLSGVGSLGPFGLSEVKREDLDLTRLDIKSQRGTYLLGYVNLSNAICIAADDPRLK
jgi:hypothetical protein